MNVEFYMENSYQIAEFITKRYSTSFSLATSLLKKEQRKAIFAIYGFVRLADEIVDSFHAFDKAFLLHDLNLQLYSALEQGISSNIIVAAFVDTIKKYHIELRHINAFMESMKNDLTETDYVKREDFTKYVYGSADVVGLMCLKVFCDGNQMLYDQLEYAAQKLGSAFQKVNFLRDLHSDKTELGRTYFPEIVNRPFDHQTKQLIEKSIEDDFNEAWIGIRQLPGRSKLAVALAYFYYQSLFQKIKRSSPDRLLSERVRIHNMKKYWIMLKVAFLYKTKLI
ncbi:MAG: phytoene/squalene synthase family protein [Microbacter sp.]